VGEGHLSGEVDPRRERADAAFLLLAGLFLGSLVVCNLVANKFLTVDLGFKSFVLSAGALAYPVTFLVTDLLSEVYGQRRANQVVRTGFVVSLFVLFVLWLGAQFPALADSPVSDAAYDQVFHNAWRVIAASMTAYLAAQLVDIRVFHFWKRLTGGRHLWLRNNASTVFSQFLDSTLVVLVLFAGVWPAEQIVATILDLWLFKALVALADTPLFYAGAHLLKRHLDGPAGGASE